MNSETTFWNRVNKSSDCWFWGGNQDRYGYGYMRFKGKKSKAHRLSWQFVNGGIPTNCCVLHKCDVRNCVNPSHLFIGSHKENMRDMFEKGRVKKAIGENSGAAKLRECSVLRMRILKNVFSVTELSKIFNVSNSHTSRILKNKQWTYLIGNRFTDS